MESKNKLILISARTEDTVFFKQMAFNCQLDFIQPESWQKLVSEVVNPHHSVFIWDLDNPQCQNISHPLANRAVQEGLTGSVDASRVFALSDKPISQYAGLINEGETVRKPYQHNLMRRYNPISQEIYGKLVAFSFAAKPGEIKSFFSGSDHFRSLEIKQSEHRKPATEAILNFIQKSGIGPRLSSKVAQAADEMLINAIFDAAVDQKGNPFRHLLDRRANFPFEKNERVELQLSSGKDYAAICVSDFFGSLNKEVVLKYVNQNFYTQDYKVRRTGPGAGLGLYGLVQSGLSLLLVCKPGSRTDAIVFFRKTASYLDFKESFHFTACFVS